MRLRMFTRKYWIIIRKYNLEPCQKNYEAYRRIYVNRLYFSWIYFSNVLIVRKHEIDFQFLESIYAFVG